MEKSGYLKRLLPALLLLIFAGVGYAQSPLVESVDFGPIYNTGTGLVFNDYNPNATGTNVPLTVMYVYITGAVTGTGIFDGTGGTPSITVTEQITLNNIPTFSENVTGQDTASGPLANGSTEPFSFTGPSAMDSEQVTQNLANYSGTGTFTINVDAALQSAIVTGGNYDQNNSTFPVSGDVTVSFNAPYTPVPEPSAWAFYVLAGVGCLIMFRKLQVLFSTQTEDEAL